MESHIAITVSYTHLDVYKRQKEYGLGKHLVDFILHPVAETVDGDEVRFLISGKPDIMDVTVKELFDFPAGVDVVHGRSLQRFWQILLFKKIMAV